MRCRVSFGVTGNVSVLRLVVVLSLHGVIYVVGLIVNCWIGGGNDSFSSLHFGFHIVVKHSIRGYYCLLKLVT